MTPEQRKALLLKMAKANKKKPKQTSLNREEKRLAQSLSSFISKNNGAYDSEFEQKIKQIRPSWFVKKKTVNKTILLEMAKQGQKRPSNCSKDPEEKYLGIALMSYVSKTNCCYDAEFREQLYAINPNWFKGRKEYVAEKKERLLEMAKNGEPRPRYQGTQDKTTRELSFSLANYTRKTRGDYDAVFTEKIKAIAPHWFMSVHEKMAAKKERLLTLAEEGATKPSCSSKDSETRKLGVALACYISPKHKLYDQSFAEKIRKARPGWVPRTRKK